MAEVKIFQEGDRRLQTPDGSGDSFPDSKFPRLDILFGAGNMEPIFYRTCTPLIFPADIDPIFKRKTIFGNHSSDHHFSSLEKNSLPPGLLTPAKRLKLSSTECRYNTRSEESLPIPFGPAQMDTEDILLYCSADENDTGTSDSHETSSTPRSYCQSVASNQSAPSTRSSTPGKSFPAMLEIRSRLSSKAKCSRADRHTSPLPWLSQNGIDQEGCDRHLQTPSILAYQTRKNLPGLATPNAGDRHVMFPDSSEATRRNIDSHRSTDSWGHTVAPIPSDTSDQHDRTSIVDDERSKDSSSSKSHTHTSSTTSTEGPIDRPKGPRENKLEELIKNRVLRHDPEVADIVFNELSGILEYVPPEDLEMFHPTHEVSELGLLELEAAGLLDSNWEVSGCAPSSGSSTSSPQKHVLGKATESISSSVTQSAIGGSDLAKETSLSNDGPSQQVKTQKKSESSQLPRCRPFRCFHNALFPATFCANTDTMQKYRTCTGPGWKSMQHLKDHLKEVHMKQVKKLGAFQCSICLEEFADRDELQEHTDSVDCNAYARCIECNKQFDSKASRAEHQKLSHVAQENGGFCMELDDKKWKKIRDELTAFKTYSSDVKKGRCPPDQEMETWIKANTPDYQVGRPDTSEAKARNELGQWYTIFKSLCSGTKMLEHPFYDTVAIPRSEMALERILLVNATVVASKRQVHGDPPSDPDQQSGWYQEALRDTLRIAAESKHQVTYIHNSASLYASPQSSQRARQPNPTQVHGRDLNQVTLESTSMPYSSASMQAYSDNPFSRNFLADRQPLPSLATQQNTLSSNIALIGGEPNNDLQYYTGVGEFSLNHDYLLPEDNNFGASGSDMLEEDAFSGNWTG